MMLVRCFSLTSAYSFIILSDIPSGPVAILGFSRLISIFISSFFDSEKLYILGLEHFFLIWLILGWFFKLLIIASTKAMSFANP